MKRTLHLFSLLLLAMAGSVNCAWADRDTSKPIYCPVNDESYEYVKEAFDAIKGNAATELEIQIWGTRPKLGSDANSRIDVPAGKTLSIVPKVSGIILAAGSHNRGNIWFLNAQDNATFNIGSSEYAMTIEGYGFNDNNRQLAAVCANEKKGVMNITNVTFSKFRFGVDGTKYGYVFANKSVATSATEGFVTMTDVTITNCETDNAAFINSINTNSDAICLKGRFTISHREGKSEPVFSLAGRIKLGDKASNNVYNDFTAPNLITIKWAGATTIGTNVIVKVPAAQATGIFDVTNEGFGLVRSGNGGDMKLTQAEPLNVSAAAAATFVLPFESTIPSGISAYKLSYTAGTSYVRTEEVTATLPANTPVLINAAEGSYKFVSTATSGDAATGTDPVRVGALTGVFSDFAFTADNIEGKYILNNIDGKVCFYKAAAGLTVGKNHAYLTADNADARLSINVDDNPAGVSHIENGKLNIEDKVYDLQGRRVESSFFNTQSSIQRKGIYVKNGKKYIIK